MKGDLPQLALRNTRRHSVRARETGETPVLRFASRRDRGAFKKTIDPGALARQLSGMAKIKSSLNHPMHRRDFIQVAATAVAAGAAWSPLKARAATKLEPLAPGIKVSLQISRDATDEDLRFAQQLGVEYVNIPTGGDKATLENFIRLKEKVEAAKLKVWNIGNSNVHNMPEVTLNLPGRDEKIEEYKSYLRNLAKAGIFYTTYAHMGNGIWSSARETTRGGAGARFRHGQGSGYWAARVFEGPLTHGRKYQGTSFGKTILTSLSRSCGCRRAGHAHWRPSG
jgi:hypothetical protein